jgi:hypothetical protein
MSSNGEQPVFIDRIRKNRFVKGAGTVATAAALAFGVSAALDILPQGARPHLAAAAPESNEPVTVETSVTTTTTQPEIVEKRELTPNQNLGTITLTVSGTGPNGEAPMLNTVTVPLHTDSRSASQAANGIPAAENDPELLRGAILHIDTPLPGSLTKAEAAVNHYIPVIAAHRLTPVNELSHGPFYDINKLVPGDTLTVNYDNGKAFSYKEIYSGFAPAGDQLYDELFQQTNKDLLAIYACADANGQTGNGQVYDASHRYFAVFERVG